MAFASVALRRGRAQGSPWPPSELLTSEVRMWHGSVVAKGLNLRPAPRTDNTPIAVLSTGSRFEVFAESSGWYHVAAGTLLGWISAHPSYVRSERTMEADLVTVPTPHPTSRPVLLHRRAADGFARALATPGLYAEDVRALCRINSSFRSWASQEAMIRSYEAAIGTSWASWSKLTEDQRAAAKRAGFAYHPGFPVDAAHTHVGGGAMDIATGLSVAAVGTLERNGFRRDTAGDAVHWGWHG